MILKDTCAEIKQEKLTRNISIALNCYALL